MSAYIAEIRVARSSLPRKLPEVLVVQKLTWLMVPATLFLSFGKRLKRHIGGWAVTPL